MATLTATIKVGSSRRGCAVFSATVPDDALDRSEVANLSAQDILRMTTNELVRVILAGDLPMLNPFARSRLKFNDRSTLERLAFLARACCRNRSAGAMNGKIRSEQHGFASLRDGNECVAREITRQLAATGRFPAHSVEVFASADIVTLRGRVPTYYQKQLAQSVALRVIGERQLDNCVDVV